MSTPGNKKGMILLFSHITSTSSSFTQSHEIQFPSGNTIHFYEIPLKLRYAVADGKAQGQTLSPGVLCRSPVSGVFSMRCSSEAMNSPEHGPDFDPNRFRSFDSSKPCFIQ
jgi:hypothetical protein